MSAADRQAARVGQPTSNGIDATLRRVAATGDPLAEYQRAIVGKAVRIHIPLTDVVKLREHAAMLRVLASKLDFLSRDARPDYSVLFEAAYNIKLVRDVIGGRHKGKE